MPKVAPLLAGLLLNACSWSPSKSESREPPPSATALSKTAWQPPADLPDGVTGIRVRYGQELITQTARHLGPEAQGQMRGYAGNRLSCSSCHLDAGQRQNALGFVGIAARFPQYRARENKLQTLAQRINGCMERSLNGRALPLNSPPMLAMLAYMDWLSQDYARGSQVKGQGLPKIPLLDRAAEPEQGRRIFARKCASCHGPQGQGQWQSPQDRAAGYRYPPLWGSDSFNDGAGMHRLLTAAAYIKANMPYGAANLTVAEAFDVAAYLNSRPRPHRAGLDQDYPERAKKPPDAPFGPWNDRFSARQHQLGPYPPMLKPSKADR